ncbi:MAG: hypothetical protein Kow00109_06160 [Acidobacteriota bacterium]
MRSHPVSRGRLCVRGWNLHELLSSPERILRPRLREGSRWRTVDYPAAFSWISQRLRQLGETTAEEAAVLASPRASNEESFLAMRFAREILRTNNVGLSAEGGYAAVLQAMREALGSSGGTVRFEWLREADFLLAVDYDATRQNPIVGSELHLAARRGAFLAVVDSRRTQLARLATRFLQVRPGTTDFLLAAFAKHLVETGAATDSLKFCAGAATWRETLAALSWEKLLAATGLERAQIAETAEQLAGARRAVALFPAGIFGLPARTVRWLLNLFSTAGRLGESGSGVFPVPGINNLRGALDMGVNPAWLPGYHSIDDAEARRRFAEWWGTEPPGDLGFSPYELFEQGKRLRLLFVVDHDEGAVRFAEALEAVETVVYIGAFENPFTKYAHVVLPVASYAETAGTFTNGEPRVQFSGPKLSPPQCVLEGWQLWVALAAACGRIWPYRRPADVMEEIAALAPGYRGITHELLAKTWGGIHLAIQGKNGGDVAEDGSVPAARRVSRFIPVQDLGEPTEPSPEFPFLLLFGKSQHYWHLNNLMSKTFLPRREYNATLLLYPEGFVEMAAEDARQVGVRDKDRVRIRSRRGAMELQVRISEDVLPGAVYVPYFVRDMVDHFLLEHRGALQRGETSCVPVRIERIGDV